MKELKHTNVDLEVREHYLSEFNSDDLDSYSSDEWDVLSDEYVVATFWDGVHGEMNAKENATLYAVAPEMLEALIELRRCYRIFHEDSLDHNTSFESDIDKIIEKATGMKIEDVIGEYYEHR